MTKIDPKNFLKAALVLAATTAAGPQPPKAEAQEPSARPNIVLVMTDDQGIGDFTAAGNAVIETPNLDALARRSASLETFYVSPVCSPTRACLMTGRYNYRTRCIDTWLGRSMMDPKEVTIAEVLGAAGYVSGIFGKWHLGDCYPMRPQDQGFDETLVLRGGGLAQPADPPESKRRYTDPVLFHNGRQVQTKGFCTDVYFDAGMEFIEKSHKAGENFFAYIATNAPHGPYHDVPEDLRKYYAKKDLTKIMVDKPSGERALAAELDKLSRIAAMITNIDQNVGRLMARLEKLGLTENTLVIFLVDNGPNSRRYVGKRRGMKSHVHDGGVRSPLWMHWPARLKAGHKSDRLAAHIDVMPTILDACGVKPPEKSKLDGRSLLPLFAETDSAWPDRTIVIQSHRGDRPQRYGHFMIRGDQYKLLHASGFGREKWVGEPKFELYDMRADPEERNNLVESRPEVVARLKKAYDHWFDDVSSTRPNNYAPPRIHLGTPHENPTVLTRQDWRGGTWQKDSVGYWNLHVARAGRYAVRLVFDASDMDEIATLRVTGAPVETAGKVAAGDKHRDFFIELPAGDTRLEATLDATVKGSPRQRGVYQVVVSRVHKSDPVDEK